MISKIFYGILISAIVLIIQIPVFALEEAERDNANAVDEDLYYFMGMGDYVNVDVKVASMFHEDDMVVGSSVSRMTPDMWKKLGARRMTDALETQTAVVTYPANFGFYTTAIRGYSREAITSKGVVTMVDGVPVIEMVNGTNDSMPNFSLGALDGIEIIKGPGSAIYGSDAFHGVISLNTFESDKDTYEVDGAGAYPLYGDGSFRISQGIGEKFRINASAGYNQQAASEDLEYKYNTAEKPAGSYGNLYSQPADSGFGTYENRYRTVTGVLKMQVKPSDRLKIDVGGYAVNNRFEDFPGIKEASFIQLNQYDNSGQDSTIYICRGSAEYILGNGISVEAKGYYWYWDMLFNSNNWFDGCIVDFDVHETRAGSDIMIKQADNPINLQWLVAYSRTYSKVLKCVSHLYDKDGGRFSPFTGSTEGWYVVHPHDGMERTIDSVYAQTKWGIIRNRLFLLLGGRLDHYSDWGSQTTPRSGIIFLPSESTSVKALYGRAFRAPCGNDIYGIQNYILGNDDLKPEIIDVYELVYIFKGKDWRLSVNGFYSNWKNGIILEPQSISDAVATGYPLKTSNSGKNRAYGCELSLFYPVDPFAVELGGSYVRSTALDLKTTSNLIDVKVADNDYKTFPEYIIIAGLHYILKPLGLNFYLKNRFYLNIAETPQTDEKDYLPQYWRMDLNISRQMLEGLDLYLDIRNLTNRKNYLPSLYYSILSDEGGIPEAGISVLLRADYKI